MPPRPVALRVLTLAGVVLTLAILYPVLSGVTWGVAFAVVCWPLHRRLLALFRSRNVAAAASMAAVMVGLLVPLGLVFGQLVREVGVAQREVRRQVQTGQWKDKVRGIPYVGDRVLEEIEGATPEDAEQAAKAGLARAGNVAVPVAGGLGAFALQTLIAAFVLFFGFRDGPQLVDQVERILPLDRPDAAHLMTRAGDAVNATVAGTLFAGLVQGVTGGLVFWAVGLPGAVLWGVVMFVASILPVLGAFVVWVPAAAYLLSQGEAGKAAAVVGWGVLMAGPVGNIIYARAAGDRMKLHPVVTVLAFVGGLAVFGVAGMVLGPVVVVLTTELCALWAGRAVTEKDSTPG